MKYKSLDVRFVIVEDRLIDEVQSYTQKANGLTAIARLIRHTFKQLGDDAVMTVGIYHNGNNISNVDTVRRALNSNGIRLQSLYSPGGIPFIHIRQIH